MECGNLCMVYCCFSCHICVWWYCCEYMCLTWYEL